MEKRILKTLKAYLDTNIEVLGKEEIQDLKEQIQHMVKKSKKLVSDFTLKRVLVLCGIVAILGSICGYLVGWSLGMNCGENIGEMNVIEKAIITHDDNYHYLEYDGIINYYE